MGVGVLEAPPLSILFDAPGIFKAETAVETDEGNRIVEGYAATSDLDLQGDVIRPEALDKAAQSAIGLTVLHNHDMNQEIGVVLDAKAVRSGDEARLWVKVEISNDEDKLWSKIRQGIINKFSIRGKVDKAHRKFDRAANQQVNVVEELTLLEISLVAVPANPEAKTLRSYVSKALAEFVEKGGQIPEAKEVSQMADATLYEEWLAYCEQKGLDPFVAEVGEGQDEAEVLKAAGERVEQEWEEFVKQAKKPYPYPYPYPKPAKKGDASKLVSDAMAALKKDKPDVAAALKVLDALKKLLAAPKAKGDEPVADAGKKAIELLDDMISKATDETKDVLSEIRALVEQLASEAKPTDKPKAVDAAPEPKAPPEGFVPATAVKEAVDAAVAKTHEEYKAKAEEIGLTFTLEEVDAYAGALMRRLGVVNPKDKEE